MKLKPGEEIEYQVLADGIVVMARKSTQEIEDPVIEQFLQFLAKDMAHNPSRIKPFDASLMSRAAYLTDGMDVDLDAPLTDDE